MKRPLALWLVALIGIAPAAWPQAWPAKPIRLIVAFPAGGGSDVMARVLVARLAERVGQSFVVDMVGAREDLPNAIALNSSMVNAARLLGPTVAGVLIAGVGEGYCFLIDAISYLAVIASLLTGR